MNPPTACLGNAVETPSIPASARHQPPNANDLTAILRVAEAARVLSAALQAAGLKRIAA